MTAKRTEPGLSGSASAPGAGCSSVTVVTVARRTSAGSSVQRKLAGGPRANKAPRTTAASARVRARPDVHARLAAVGRPRQRHELHLDLAAFRRERDAFQLRRPDRVWR